MKKNLAPQLSRADFNRICRPFALPAPDRKALAGLVYFGKPVGKELHAKIDGRWRRSRKNGQYAKLMEALLAALTAHSEHRFPPKDWQPSKAQLARIRG